MKKMLAFLLFAFSCCHAQTILTGGECQNLTMFNATDNTSFVEEYCAANCTVLNITNITVQNITNITNTSVYMCNATTETAWANTTVYVNNATVFCLSNASITYNITNTTIVQNTTVQNMTNCTIPTNYCYQNVNDQLGFLSLFRNDACNITLTTPACSTNCPICQDATCPDPPVCDICQSVNETCNETVAYYTELMQNESTQQQAAYSSTIDQLQGQSRLKDDRIAMLTNVSNTIPDQVATQVQAQTWFVPFLEIGVILSCVVFVAFVVWRKIESSKLHHNHIGTAAQSDKEKEHIGKAGAGNVWGKI